MRSLVLIGYKGCGKTTLGRELAMRLDWEFIDTDELILKRAEGRSCRDLALEIGERGFRETEREVIRHLQSSCPTVVSVGGGAVLNSANVSDLKRFGRLVYLACDPRLLWKRLKGAPIPSFLDSDDLRGSFDSSYRQRERLYLAVADAIVQGNGPDSLTRLVEVAHGQQ